MAQDPNRDLYEYGRRGRGVGLGVMLALLAVLVFGGLFWFGTRVSDDVSERLTPKRQTTGVGSGRELPTVRPTHRYTGPAPNDPSIGAACGRGAWGHMDSRV